MSPVLQVVLYGPTTTRTNPRLPILWVVMFFHLDIGYNIVGKYSGEDKDEKKAE